MDNRRESTSQAYDAVIVGAGAMGSATAYHLAQSGQRVLLLEQFQVAHTRGSSHGGSRIIRYAHDSVDYTRWMPATYALWRALEAESGEALMRITGGLHIGLESDPFLHDAQQVLDTLQIPYSLLSVNEVNRQFPQFRLADHWKILWQEQTGILAASRCVQTLVAQARRHGAHLVENARVQEVLPTGNGVTVYYWQNGTLESVSADRAILTAGPWAQKLLQPLLGKALPLQPTHQQVAYFRVEKPEYFTPERCPVYVFFDSGPGLYGFPIFEHPGYVKVATELIDTKIDPDQELTIDPVALAALASMVAETLVGVEARPAWAECCRYTETPTRDFIIDRHPDYPQVLFAAGFSGRGFKHSIAIGRLLADLAAGEPGEYKSEFWLPRFALKNFVG